MDDNAQVLWKCRDDQARALLHGEYVPIGFVGAQDREAEEQPRVRHDLILIEYLESLQDPRTTTIINEIKDCPIMDHMSISSMILLQELRVPPKLIERCSPSWNSWVTYQDIILNLKNGPREILHDALRPLNNVYPLKFASVLVWCHPSTKTEYRLVKKQKDKSLAYCIKDVGFIGRDALALAINELHDHQSWKTKECDRDQL